MASALAPLTVRCPFCREPRESPCRSKGGYTGGIHAARKKAIAHLSETERLAAYDVMRAEQESRRDEAVAAFAKLADDPEFQERRRAISANWDNIGRAAGRTTAGAR